MPKLAGYAAPVLMAAALALVAPARAAPDDRPPASGTRPAGQAIDDSVITGKVKAKLMRSQALAAARGISVSTHDGVVQLGGTVETSEQAQLAESLAGEVAGVAGVDNRIESAKR